MQLEVLKCLRRKMLCKYNNSCVCYYCGHIAKSPLHIRQCSRGPGTELQALLGRFGVTASGDCKCTSRAAYLDKMGCDWAEANLEEIVGWLRESAAERGLPFLDLAGRVLVRRAIHNARRKEAARAQASAQAEGPAAGGAA
jgi:hypothetical protein